MSDSVISKLSVELEASQKRLDRDLDEAEEKTKRSGERMEESLSLGGLASKLLAAFAALGTVETGLRGAAGVAELLRGNADEALAAFERMPFGIGSAVQAGHELFDTLRGTRDQTEQIIKDFGQLPDLVRTAKSEIASLQDLLADPGSRNEQALAGANDRTARLNEQLAGLTDIIGKLARFEADRTSGEFFGSRTGPRFGSGRIEDTPEALRTALEEAGIAAKTVGDALRELREQRDALFALGVSANQQDVEDLRSRQDEALRRMAQDRISQINSFEGERIALEREFAERISNALTEEVARQLEDDLRRALADVDRRQREAALNRDRFELELREQQRRQAEPRVNAAREPRQTDARGLSVEEFLRLSPGTTGRRQEVRDPEGNDILNVIRDTLLRMLNNPNTATLG